MSRLHKFINDNWDRIVVVGLLIAVSIALILLTVPYASADQNQSSIVVTDISTLTEQITPIPTNVALGTRIDQGSCVFPGETIDIAGMGWYTGKIVNYGLYYNNYAGDNYSWQASYDVPAQNLTHFYLEPGFFSQHLGWWFPDDSDLDSSGYDRMFYVNDTCPEEFRNISGRIISQYIPPNMAENESQIQAAIVANLTKMPVLSENDGAIIISQNVTTPLAAPNGTHSWMFGTDSPPSLYDITIPYYNATSFDSKVMSNLESGHYNMIFVDPGKNGILEETYDSVANSISSPFRNVQDTSLIGISPLTAEDRLLAKIASSRDDSYTQWKVDLQAPKIMIMKLDQSVLSDNHSVIVLDGYTNMNQGDTLTVVLDANKTNQYITHSWKAIVQDNGGEGAYRTWNTSFIIDFNQIAPGMHYFTVTSNEGATAIIPIYRRVELLPHYQPPEQLGFFDNSPFIPTPTPEVIIQKVPGPVQTVIQTVTITPSKGQIDAATFEVLSPWIIAGIIVLIGLILMAWVWSAVRRVKHED